MAFERGEKKFLNAKTSPLSSSLYFGAGVTRPGELTCIFFLRGTLTMSPPSLWFSALSNLNLFKLELDVDYLFLKQTNSKTTANTKDTGLPCSDIPCLLRTEKSNDRSVVTPSPLAFILKCLQVINNQVWPILAASSPYLDWFLPFMFCLHSRR